MSDAVVLVNREGAVWQLRLNRPQKGNACSTELVQALTDALDRAAQESAEAVVIEGAGRHFCTGFDLSTLETETEDSLLGRFVRIELLLQRIARASFLTVAHAHGRTIGAGADIFAACTLRLAQSGTSFAFPGAQGFGLVLGTRRLATRVGTGTALEWVRTGRAVGLEEACEHGLATAMAPGERVRDIVMRHVEAHALECQLQLATSADAGIDDARDLELLVRSAARPGLRGRIRHYLERVAAARAATP